MRKLPLLLGILACTALTGCDWWQKAPTPLACHCEAPVAAPLNVAPAQPSMRRAEYAEEGETRVARHGTRHYSDRYSFHRRYRHSSRYQWSDSRAEASVDVYGYSSSSHAYGSGYAYGAQGHGDCCAGGDMRAHYGETTRVWADGYGRRHIYDASAVRHYTWQAHQRRAGEGARLDPWHGYDDDWE